MFPHSPDGGAAERAPQPGVRELEALIARTREAGLDASLTVKGATRDLPATVDLSVDRIVQGTPDPPPHRTRLSAHELDRAAGSISARGAGQQRGLAAQRLAGGARDLNVDQVAGRAESVEVDDLVVAGAPAQP
jgi:hypothetical protein